MSTIAKRLVLAWLVLMCAHAAGAQTADAVIEQSIAAIGGRAALGKLTSRSAVGAITLATPAGSFTGAVEIQNAMPNKARTVIDIDLSAVGAGKLHVDQRFDGTSGYVMDSLQGNRDITGRQLDNLRNGSFPSPLLNYKTVGMTARLGGTNGSKEKVGDRDAYVLTLEPSSGSAVRQYIDAETHLTIRVVAMLDVPQLGREVEQTTELSDYRDVDGVKIPFRVHATSEVQDLLIVLTKVEHNTRIDAALFKKPEK